MKKISVYIGIFILLVGFFGPTRVVHAEQGDCTLENDVGTRKTQHNIERSSCVGTSDTVENYTITWEFISFTPYSTTNPAPAADKPPGVDFTNTVKPADGGCGITSMFTNFGTCVVSLLANISYLILRIMALILWVSGATLDFVINYTIVNMSTNIAQLTGINIAWKMLRDLMNMAFIFILIYQATRLIIGQSDTAKIKKFITGIVMASVLINFSLFFTKIMIDGSNIATIGFYNSIIKNAGQRVAAPALRGQVTEAPTTGDIIYNAGGISIPFMKALGLSSFFSSSALTAAAGDGGGDENILIIGLLGSVLFLIVSFSFLAVTCMFLIRYIVLLVLLMTSPLAYMGMGLDFMEKYAKEWWDTLKGQLFFAPIYMLMTWMVLTLITSPGFLTKNGIAGSEQASWASLVTGNTTIQGQSAIALVFNFAVIVGLIILTLINSKTLATRGAAIVSTATNLLTGSVGNVAMGGASKIGRNTVGRLGSALSESEWLKNRASGKYIDKNGKEVEVGILGRNLAKFSLKSADKTAKSSFDVRSTAKFGELAGTAGINFGKGADKNKVNFRQDLENKAKAEQDFAKTLKLSDEAVEKETNKTQKPLDDLKKATDEKLKVQGKELEEMKEKKAQMEKDALEEEKTLQEKKSKMEKDAEDADRNGDAVERTRLEGEIKNIEKEIGDKKTESEKMKDVADKEIEKKNKDVEQLKKDSKDAKDKSEANLARIKNLSNARIDAYADTFSKEGAMMTWSKNILKMVPGAALGGITGGYLGGASGGILTGLAGDITTPGDKKKIASVIRKAKDKGAEDKALDDLKKALEAKAKKDADKTKGDEEKPKEGEKK